MSGAAAVGDEQGQKYWIRFRKNPRTGDAAMQQEQ
jgi:hypothetical protein